uniref:Neprosin PEP catalytic domain-containing protein n=1 Tax=Oryza punctata TaxID=4537 RepID=A0A0E0K659_ORYPU
MKENNILRLTVLSYLVLTIGGKGLKSVSVGESQNSDPILTSQQVNQIIQAEDGDIYDCVDVNQQPTFKHPLFKDHKVQMEPSSFPIGLDIKSSSVAAVSQAQLSTIDCPIGTVPILRNNEVDTMMVQRIGKLTSNDVQQQLAAGIKYFDDVYGTRASINVYDPKVKKDSNDLSASWIQIGNVPKVTDGDEIGAGSWVSARTSGDNFARFHIAWDPKTKNWWLAYGSNNTLIGYWPSSQFSYIKDIGNFAFWGGYVQGPTASSDPPQMGSGHFASEGYGKAAFIRNIQVIKDENNKLVTPNIRNAYPGSDDRKLYTDDGYGINDDGMHVYYGWPGKYS